MLLGVPKEIKTDEYRVGLVPATIRVLAAQGHKVLVQTHAGESAGISDEEYAAAGAEILPGPEPIFANAELIVKVKEPLGPERRWLRRGQVIFTYLHLAADPELARDLMASGATAIAYETITDAAGKLPLLSPMSKIAGRMAPQVAAHFLERPQGGRGILLGKVDRIPAAQVLVLGGGVVGSNAAQIALGMGADVCVVVRSPAAINELTQQFEGRARVVTAATESIAELCIAADVVIGAALVPGGAAPKLVSAETVKRMKPGAVIVDVSIDQGGCAETSHPTTHSRPTFVVDSVLHYCVANMPGAVPRTSTFALSGATHSFTLELANKGFPRALIENEHLLRGLNVHEGKITCRAVAEALRLAYATAIELLAA
jgi:alanine dehydrogenase